MVEFFPALVPVMMAAIFAFIYNAVDAIEAVVEEVVVVL